MSSVPNSYIDDLRSIVLATLNRIEQLRMRVVYGLEQLKGAFGQELIFDSDGNIVAKSFRFENLASAPSTPYTGLTYYNSATDIMYVYIGSAWVDIGPGGGVTDHGALTGLADDDHTQYLLINGSRAMSNDLDIGNNYINNCNIINMDAGFHPAAYIKPVFTDPTYDLKIWGESEIMFFNGSLGSESESVSITTEHLDLHSNKAVNVGTPTADTDAATKGYADALPGVDGVSFIIDQDNAGAGVSSSLRFNRGSTDGDAAIWWDEGDDEFQFESDVGVTVGNIKVAAIAATKVVTGDHGTAATDEVVNVCYGTSATPPTASTTTEGALYIQYTA